jgi:hypothetical protein
METFADTSAFNAGVKKRNTKTNKITIVKNQKLATQTKKQAKTASIGFALSV